MHFSEKRQDYWRPNGAGAVVPGRSAYETLMRDLKGPRLTTNSRANASVEAYWLKRRQNMAGGAGQPPAQYAAMGAHNLDKAFQQMDGDNPLGKLAGKTSAGALPGQEPGGEHEIAARVKREGRSANVKLGDERVGFYVPSWPGTPKDLPEKEHFPRRGVVGFTGTSPEPGQHRDGPSAPDPSKLYAINACDAERPWTTGIRGYTGHQLPPELQGRSDGGEDTYMDSGRRTAPQEAAEYQEERARALQNQPGAARTGPPNQNRDCTDMDYDESAPRWEREVTRRADESPAVRSIRYYQDGRPVYSPEVPQSEEERYGNEDRHVQPYSAQAAPAPHVPTLSPNSAPHRPPPPEESFVGFSRAIPAQSPDAPTARLVNHNRFIEPQPMTPRHQQPPHTNRCAPDSRALTPTERPAWAQQPKPWEPQDRSPQNVRDASAPTPPGLRPGFPRPKAKEPEAKVLGQPTRPAPFAYDPGFEGSAQVPQPIAWSPDVRVTAAHPNPVVGGHPLDPATAGVGEGRPWAAGYDQRGAYWSHKPHHERLTDPGLGRRPGDWYDPHQARGARPVADIKTARMRGPPWACDIPEEELVYTRSRLNTAAHGGPANEIRYPPRTAWE